MAIWHFSFNFVPRSGIVNVYGSIPLVLDEFTEMESNIDFDSVGMPDYWVETGIDLMLDVVPLAEKILSQKHLLVGNEVKIGSRNSHLFLIDNSDIMFEYHLGYPNRSVLIDVLDLAKDLECMVVLEGTGEVCKPEFAIIIEKIKDSTAYEFSKVNMNGLTSKP